MYDTIIDLNESNCKPPLGLNESVYATDNGTTNTMANNSHSIKKQVYFFFVFQLIIFSYFHLLICIRHYLVNSLRRFLAILSLNLFIFSSDPTVDILFNLLAIFAISSTHYFFL